MLSAIVLSSGNLSVRISTSTGAYALLYGPGNNEWLESGPPLYLGSQLIIKTTPARERGVDRLGAYDALTLEWSAIDDDGTGQPLLATTFAAYGGNASTLRFTQTWLRGANVNASIHINSSDPTTMGLPLGRFPSFLVPNNTHRSDDVALNAFRWGGCQLQYSGRSVWDSTFSARGAQTSMPIVWFDKQGHSIAMGPAGPAFFTAVHATVPTVPGGKTALACGPAASLYTLPRRHNHSTLIVAENSINAATAAYGAQLRVLANKTKRVDAMRESFVLSHLGYWTDNGAPYYHCGQHCPSAYNQSAGCKECSARGNCTFEDALLGVRDDALRRSIPLRYFQWDDEESLNPTSWPPSRFPDGASHWLGNDSYGMTPTPMSLSLYNGEWSGSDGTVDPSTGAPYAFTCATGPGSARPGCVATDPAFFRAVLANGTRAGMAMMEQDYICSTTSATSRVLGAGEAWFRALDLGATANNVDVQLCMMNPAHALASTSMAHASNGRGTGDHVVRNAARGLALGASSILINAVGMWPSRDNVWTNSTTNVSGIPTEHGPAVQSLLALLAGGPYGVADLAGTMNRSLVMMGCRSDGVLLRPSIPALPLDATLIGAHFAASSGTPSAPPYVWRGATELLVQDIHNGERSPPRRTYASLVVGLNLDKAYSLALGSRSEVGDAALGRIAELTGLLSIADNPVGSNTADEYWVVFEAWHALERCKGNATQCDDFRVVASSKPFLLPACAQISDNALGHTFWQVQPLFMVSPTTSVALLGEIGKIVKLSQRRFLELAVYQATTTGLVLTATVNLAVRESIVVAVLLVRVVAGITEQSVVHTTCNASRVKAAPQPSEFWPTDLDVVALLTCRNSTGGLLFSCMCE